MIGLSLIPLPYRLAALGAGVAAAALAVWGYGSHRYAEGHQAGYSIGHGEFTGLQAEMTAKAEKAAHDQWLIEEQRKVDLKENSDESQRIAARDRAAHAAADVRVAAADDRVRSDVAAITARSGQAGGDTGVARQCAADVAALAVVFSACREEYRQLAHDADVELDDARQRGGEAAADYDALTPR